MLEAGLLLLGGGIVAWAAFSAPGVGLALGICGTVAVVVATTHTGGDL